MTTVAERQAAPSLSTWERVRGWVTNPWGRPRFLVLVTWGYMIWAIVPVLIAIQFSFNASRSRTTWAGFSTRWYWGDPVDSVWNDPGLRHSLEQSLKLAGADVLIATPIGVLLALLAPAIVASAAIVFAISIDDFVISQWLSSGEDTDTVPIQIYSATRGAPLPSTNAIATIMLLVTFVSILLAFLVWRVFTRGERRAAQSTAESMGAFTV